MSGPRRLALLAALVVTLSCSTWSPPNRAIALTGPAPVPALHGPGTAEWVEARFRAYQSALGNSELSEVAHALVRAAEQHDVPLDLVLAVIHTESGFHNFARSRVGALGLMQIMPRTGETLAEQLDVPWTGPEQLFEPVLNIRMGTYYLAHLHDRFASWDKALAAYNWGPSAIDRRLRRGHKMPQRYVAKVYSKLQSPGAL